MTRSVVVVDYGMGNLRSVSQAVAHAATQAEHPGDWRVVVSGRPEDVQSAERIVLPGQGAIRDCMRELAAGGLGDAVLEAARTKPLLGICVGMQMLMRHSQEQDTPGFGLFDGDVVRFAPPGDGSDGPRLKVPHMGWNGVRQRHDAAGRAHPLWSGIADGASFYFVHSFHVRAANAAERCGETDYGVCFTSAVARDNIFATQFHPEKSAATGLRLLQNFLGWSP